MWHYTDKSRRAAMYLLDATGLSTHHAIRPHVENEDGVLSVDWEAIAGRCFPFSSGERVLLDVLGSMANGSDLTVPLTSLYRLDMRTRQLVVTAYEVALLNPVHPEDEISAEDAMEVAESYGVAI